MVFAARQWGHPRNAFATIRIRIIIFCRGLVGRLNARTQVVSAEIFTISQFTVRKILNVAASIHINSMMLVKRIAKTAPAKFLCPLGPARAALNSHSIKLFPRIKRRRR
jgi:hypothetical protein